jgi:SAM-dependent methyltransferase
MTLRSRFFAMTYDRQMTKVEKAGLRACRDGLLAGAVGQVLEIGAGTGSNLRFYGPAVESLTLTEPEIPMLRRLERKVREQAPTAAVLRAPAEDLPFEDATFDVVVSTLVLCGVDDQPRALRELRRVLRPGPGRGALASTGPAPQDQDTVAEAARRGQHLITAAAAHAGRGYRSGAVSQIRRASSIMTITNGSESRTETIPGGARAPASRATTNSTGSHRGTTWLRHRAIPVRRTATGRPTKYPVKNTQAAAAVLAETRICAAADDTWTAAAAARSNPMSTFATAPEGTEPSDHASRRREHPVAI